MNDQPDRERDPDRAYAGGLNLMERWAVRFLRRRSGRDETDVHVWSDREIERIRAQGKRALWLAALSGTISGATIAGIELGLREILVDDMETAGLGEMAGYWGAYLALAGLVTGVEILYLYWLVLRMVADVGEIAGFGLARANAQPVVATGLSRAALDMPNPHTRFHGVDPYARIPRWQLLLYSVAYRAKVGVTSLLMRVLVRRILARAAVRFIVPFVAIPVYAAWNCLIIHWVMREARIRAAGPIAINQIEERVKALRDDLEDDSARLLVALVGEAMMCARDAHPNFLLLLRRLIDVLGVDPETFDVDWDACCDHFSRLDENVQQLALDLLSMSAVLGGKPGRRQKRMVAQAFEACGHSSPDDHLDHVYRAFSHGQGMVCMDDR